MNAIRRARRSAFALGTGLGLQLLAVNALACEIEVGIRGEPRAEYRTGDELIFEIKVILTHRNCPEGIDATQFDARGLTLVGATKWKETAPGVFVRLLKTSITEAREAGASLRVSRKCNKEGGQGLLAIKVAR